MTTAIGLISLFTSNLAPISNFGLYSAIGVIMTLGILVLVLARRAANVCADKFAPSDEVVRDARAV